MNQKKAEEKLITKFDEKPSLKYGIEPENRTISQLLEHGYVNVDKHAGPTSHEVTDMLKRILEIEKAGHSGTLDPQVTGVLLCGLGKATRLMEFMLKSNKEYVCLLYLHKPVTDKQLDLAVKNFTGKIKQTPPIKSAVKRQERERTIYSIKVLSKKKDNQYVLMRVACEHGTYMRSLCHDMGQFLGIGGQMVELRRTKAGPITENDNIISLDKLNNLLELYKKDKKYEKELRKYLRPQEELLSDFKKIYARDSAVNSLSHGSDLAIPGIAKFEEGIELGETIAVLTLRGELVAMGTSYMSSKDIAKKKKGAVVKTHKVFIEKDSYPKMWKFGEEI